MAFWRAGSHPRRARDRAGGGSLCSGCRRTAVPDSSPAPSQCEAEFWADGVLRDVGHRPVVLLSPGAGWGAKRWPAERYGAVARELHQQGCMVLVNAGPEERAIAAEVVRASGGVAQAPEFTLERLIALTRRVCLVIAGDTGPLHLACALGKPVVGIYGPTDPASQRTLWSALPGAATPRKQTRPHPARGARGRPVDHYSAASGGSRKRTAGEEAMRNGIFPVPQTVGAPYLARFSRDVGFHRNSTFLGTRPQEAPGSETPWSIR